MGFLSFVYRQLFVVPSAPPSTLNLSGKTVLITGGNTGIGFETAKQLLTTGKLSHLILGVRDATKGESAREELLKLAPDATVEVWTVDMADPASVVSFAGRFSEQPLEIAILNAGVYEIERTVAPATGNETCVQVNHLSTALLGVLLLPALRRAEGGGGRLTVVSSEMALWVKWKAAYNTKEGLGLLEYLNTPESYDKGDRYPLSKLLGVWWTLELAKVEKGVTINIVNPGLCKTGLHRSFTGSDKKSIEGFKKVVARTRDLGARVVVHAAAVAGKESHGNFISENKIVKDRAVVDSPQGKKVQTKLWNETIAELEKTVPDIKQRIGVIEPVTTDAAV